MVLTADVSLLQMVCPQGLGAGHDDRRQQRHAAAAAGAAAGGWPPAATCDRQCGAPAGPAGGGGRPRGHCLCQRGDAGQADADSAGAATRRASATATRGVRPRNHGCTRVQRLSQTSLYELSHSIAMATSLKACLLAAVQRSASGRCGRHGSGGRCRCCASAWT